MKKFILSITVIFCSAVIIYGQNQKKYDTKASDLTKQLSYDLLKVKQLPHLTIDDVNKNKSFKSLPSRVDNSELQYFRPIFNQYGWSCNQSASIGYMLTYELNYKHNTSAALIENQYPFLFPWNYLNDGSSSTGVSPFDSWEIIKRVGCPSVADFEAGTGRVYSQCNEFSWISGYDYYYNAMKNRISDLSIIKVDTPDGLSTLKHWLNDHMTGSDYGGVANFQIASTGWDIIRVDSSDNDLPIILSFGQYVGHSMTFVGYDDNIHFDYNGDGQYTNNIDTNDDGIVDMRDWEIGAMITINSWGPNWWGGSGGKVYTMYRVLAEPTDLGGIWNNAVQVVDARIDYEPSLTMKVRMSHNQRDKIKISAGVTTDLTVPKPQHTIDFPIFNYQGGEIPMMGNDNSSEMEIGLDITPLLSYVNSGETAMFFLIIDEAYSIVGSTEGTIHEFSVINYLDATRVYTSTETEVPIEFYAQTTMSLIANITFDELEITTEELPQGKADDVYIHRLNATGGTQPYKWTMKMDYDVEFDYEVMSLEGTEELSLNGLNLYGYVKKDIDFSFPFYNQSFNSVYISADGALVFDENIFMWPYVIDEELPLRYNKAIAPFGHDLSIYPTEGDGLFYEGDSHSATFRWDASIDVRNSKTGQTEAHDVDFMVRLYTDGTIDFLYKHIRPGDFDIPWVGGISNGDFINYETSTISNSTNIPEGYRARFTPLNIIPGVTFSDEGVLFGIPELSGQDIELEFAVTDNNYLTDVKILKFVSEASGLDDSEIVGKQLRIMPNPVSEEATISIYMDKGNNSDLCLFNNEGKLVSIIVNKFMDAGNHLLQWKPEDNNGNRLPAGIYHMKLISGKQVLNNKIILL